MIYDHDRKKPQQIKEPVQVYLASPDRDRLDRLTSQLDTTKSDVLRRGLEALERELSDISQHPVFRIIALAGEVSDKPDPGYDVGLEHDRYLADTEIESWGRDD